jgi:rhamnose utilization protein RhaD (predicted bifunctional aldolase and dehydrogenase)
MSLNMVARTSVRRSELRKLSHWIGDPRRELAILGEGNVSARLSTDAMLVKASGSSLATLRSEDLVEMRIAPILELLDDDAASDPMVERVLRESVCSPQGKHPSVEVLLHALCLTSGGADVVVHSHPRSVNSILCSDQADSLVRGSLFPDQVVVLGRRQLLVDYVDPGLQLAREVRVRLRRFTEENGDAPKAIYLRNHGLFALASSAAEAIRVTAMAEKVARVLIGALTAGKPVFLTDEQVERIDTRPDELLRRRILGAD